MTAQQDRTGQNAPLSTGETHPEPDRQSGADRVHGYLMQAVRGELSPRDSAIFLHATVTVRGEDGRDLLDRLLDDPDPAIRAAIDIAPMFVPADPNYTAW